MCTKFFRTIWVRICIKTSAQRCRSYSPILYKILLLLPHAVRHLAKANKTHKLTRQCKIYLVFKFAFMILERSLSPRLLCGKNARFHERPTLPGRLRLIISVSRFRAREREKFSLYPTLVRRILLPALRSALPHSLIQLRSQSGTLKSGNRSRYLL